MLLESWGIVFVVVVGYSLGEFVVSCVLGVLILEEVFRIILVRFRCYEFCSIDGFMVVFGMLEKDVIEFII